MAKGMKDSKGKGGGLIKSPSVKPGGMKAINQDPPTAKSTKAPAPKISSAKGPSVGFGDEQAFKPTSPGR